LATSDIWVQLVDKLCTIDFYRKKKERVPAVTLKKNLCVTKIRKSSCGFVSPSWLYDKSYKAFDR
jgi:hypothetical protein